MYIVALGGNAISTANEKGTFKEQRQHVDETVKHIRSLFGETAPLVITHGNGPQVGSLLLQQEKTGLSDMPLYILDSMTQAQTGYLLQESLKNNLGIESQVLLTRIIVDTKDRAFSNPTKPVGPFYQHKINPKMIKQPEGFRRVVPSPKPLEIVELPIIKNLINKYVVIACGGGGIPVIKKGDKLIGIEAVIDKDFASQLLGNLLGAETLIFLTTVDSVYLNYKKSNQIKLQTVTTIQAKQYLSEGHFIEGSMKPKIEAAILFLELGGERVLITSPPLLEKALEEKIGTIIKL